MAFTVISNSFNDGDYLPKDFVLSADFGFGCAGGNKSPHLKWSEAPAGTKSFAITCYDPDAPTGSGFWHWLIVNIPANVSELAEGAGSAGGNLPAGALQTRTDFGGPGYGGPCPPQGDHPHRYLFTVFAVKSDKLDVKPDTSAAVVGFNLNFQYAGQGGNNGAVQAVGCRRGPFPRGTRRMRRAAWLWAVMDFGCRRAYLVGSLAKKDANQ
jgi:Raf kinase inhibitor-like YbhB/YbcL family protein